MHLHSYHKIYISVWHGALGGAGSGDEEHSEALGSSVPAEGHPRPSPARLPAVPGTPTLSWVPCGSPRLSPGLALSPLQAWLVAPAVVPSSAAWGWFGFGGAGGGRWMRWVWEWGSPLAPCSESRQQARLWQAAVGRGSRAHATRVTTPRVLSAACISLYWGKGVAEAGPQGHPGHPGTLSPLPAKCCVSSVGVDLRYHLVAALPSRGHRCPRLSARVPAPCGRLPRAPSTPKPRGRGPHSPSPLPASGQGVTCWALSPKSSGGLGWVVVAVGTLKATSSPGWMQGGWRQWGAAGESWGARVRGGEGDGKRCLVHCGDAGAAFVGSTVQSPRLGLGGSCPTSVCRGHPDFPPITVSSRRDPSTLECQPRASLEQEQNHPGFLPDATISEQPRSAPCPGQSKAPAAPPPHPWTSALCPDHPHASLHPQNLRPQILLLPGCCHGCCCGRCVALPKPQLFFPWEKKCPPLSDGC